MSDRRKRVGAAGERLAAAFLSGHGVEVVARNLEVGGGELDLLAWDGAEKVAVEVRSITGPSDPLEAFDDAKATQVGRLAGLAGAHRVDLVAVRISPEAAEIRWVKGAS
jgi:putative endonuclease